MRLPLDAVRTSDLTEKIRDHIEVIDGVSYIQVHPTFLYESLWCLGVLVLLLLYRTHKKFNGEIFLLYLGGYGLGRFWIEGLRTDQLWIPGTEIPVSQVLAGTLVIVSVIWIICGRRKRRDGILINAEGFRFSFCTEKKQRNRVKSGLLKLHRL